PLMLAVITWGISVGAIALLFVAPIEMNDVGPVLARSAIGVLQTAGFAGGFLGPGDGHGLRRHGVRLLDGLLRLFVANLPDDPRDRLARDDDRASEAGARMRVYKAATPGRLVVPPRSRHTTHDFVLKRNQSYHPCSAACQCCNDSGRK